MPPRAALRGPGSIDARFLTEGAIRGAMIDALGAAGSGDEVALSAARLSDRGVIGAVLRAAGRGAHVRVLLDAGAAPNFPVAAELSARRRQPRAALARAAGAGRRPPSRWSRTAASSAASVGASDFTRPSLDDINLESAIELRLPGRAAAAQALESRFAEEWSAGAAYARYAVDSQADYWRYRFEQAAGLAAF